MYDNIAIPTMYIQYTSMYSGSQYRISGENTFYDIKQVIRVKLFSWDGFGFELSVILKDTRTHRSRHVQLNVHVV